MSRGEDEVLDDLLSLLPPGWIWRRDRDSLIAALLTPLADGIAEVEAVAEAMLREVDPRLANVCLTDFERVLGPDPCGRDPSTMATADRRLLAHQRWTVPAGPGMASSFMRRPPSRSLPSRWRRSPGASCG